MSNSCVKQVKSKYCSSISEGLKISSWLQGDQAKCLITVRKAIKIFQDHLQSETCHCIVKASNLLILSVNYYQLFLLSLENHTKSIEEEEKKYDHVENEGNQSTDSQSHSESGHGDEAISGSQFPNIEKSKPSRYSNLLLPQFVNINTQQTLLKPLNKCIQCLRESFAGASTIPIKLLEGLKINTLLLTAHNIYHCYTQPDYRYLCSRLMVELAGKILPDEKESLLTAYHLLIRFYLDYNILSKADRFLKMAQSLMVTMKIEGYQNYQAALIYLDQCEIEMRTGEEDKSGLKLKDFLKSDYLKKLTLNRYHLKGLACLVASKFPSSYQFSQEYSEFIEPLHIALTILKRWHRHLLYPDEKRPITVEEDHLWFKYEIYSFSFEILTMIKTFYMNIGFPMELSFFSNCLLALTRRNCFLNWSTQIMKIGATIDMKCDKTKCASFKLQLGILALTFKSNTFTKSDSVNSENDELKPPELTVNTHRIDLDSELQEDCDTGYSKITGNSGPDRCVHDLGHVPAWEVEKILRKGNFVNEDEDFPIDELTIMKMLNSTGMKLPFPYNLRYVELVTLICCDKKLFSKQLIDKILEIFSEFTDSNHPMYEKVIKHLHITKENFNSQEMSDVILMEATFFDLLTDQYLENGQFEPVIETTTIFLSKLILPCANLTIRDLIGRLLLKLIIAKNQLLNVRPFFPEFDSKEVQEKMIRPILVCKTPPPVRVIMNRINAPDRKPNYRMDELRDYAKSLHEAPKKQAPRKSSRILSRKSSVISDKLSSTDSDIVILSENIEPPPMVTPARRTRAPAKNKTPSTAKSKRVEPLTSSKKLTKRELKENALDSLTEAIDCITLSDDKDNDEEEEEDVFNNRQNIITEIINCPSNVTNNINALKSLLTFFSNHPPIDFYLALHYQLFLLYSSTNKPNPLAASYHFHECSNSAMVRYRAIFTTENKKRLKLPSELSIGNLVFNPVNDINYQNLSKQTQILPETWRIVQICSYPNTKSDRGIPDLMITRWQKNKKTLMIRIKGNPDKFTRNFMDEFYEIIELSNASIRKQDSQTFWTARSALNQRLEMLLQSVADTWLGPFKALLMGFTDDTKLNEFRSAIKKSVNNFFDSSFCRDEDLFNCIIEAFPTLSKQQFETAICFLFSQFSFTLLEECYHNCLEIFETFYSDEEKKVLLQNVDFHPVGLIVNKPLEGFPFESLPNAVSANQQFFRIPSLRFLISLVETHMKRDKLFTQGVNHQKAYYLLNPSANLMKTEKRFREKFLNQVKWRGVIGGAPDCKDLQSSLNSRDLYIYFGHGAGSRYYKTVPDGIDSLSIRTASLIVGCCSGKLFLDGSMFDSFGTPYRFMINGCPTYLGLLWDVTDGDIDRFADRLLSLWLPDWEQTEAKESKDDQPIKYKELCKSLIYARFACRFKLLTGAAPVIYGLPITISSH